MSYFKGQIGRNNIYPSIKNFENLTGVHKIFDAIKVRREPKYGEKPWSRPSEAYNLRTKSVPQGNMYMPVNC